MASHENFTFIPTDADSHSLAERVLGIRNGSNTLICCSNRINEYSRRKSYAFGSEGVALYGDHANDESVIKEYNFGLSPTVISKPKDGSTGTSGCAPSWGQWVAPKIDNENHSKRINDLLGYWHLATSHILSLEYSSGASPKIMVNKDFTVTMRFGGDRERIVTLDDCHYYHEPIGNMYLTVAIGSYTEASVNNPARWGAKWLIIQSDIKLEEAVNPVIAGSKYPNEISVKFNLFTANIPNLSADFAKYFIAVGFANKYSGGTAYGNVRLMNGISSNGSYLMPVTLINPDMHDRGYNVVNSGELLLTPSGETDFYVYVDLYSIGTNSADWHSGVTQNGKTGCSIDMFINLKCEIDSVIPANASKDGYLIFYITISTNKGVKGYYLITRKGCEGAIDPYGKRYIGLQIDNFAIQVYPGEADYNNSEVKDAIEWLKKISWMEADENPERLTSRSVFIPGVNAIEAIDIQIVGIPSGWTSNNILVPNVIKIDGGHDVHSLDIKGI